MRTFEVVRKKDESGVSGTGKVIEGVIFSDGHCVVRWLSLESPGHSTALFDSFGAFLSVHIAPHKSNQTQVVFSDGSIYEHTDKKRKNPRPKF